MEEKMEKHTSRNTHYSSAPQSSTDEAAPNEAASYSAATFNMGSTAPADTPTPSPPMSAEANPHQTQSHVVPRPSITHKTKTLPTRTARRVSSFSPAGIRKASSTTFNRRRGAKHPGLADKLEQMASRLAPLVQLTTGRVHPYFPSNLLKFWLLTNDQLEELARFYHQAIPCQWTAHYPSPVNGWASDLPLEEKRRKMGKFIGLRVCQSPPGLMRAAEGTMRELMGAPFPPPFSQVAASSLRPTSASASTSTVTAASQRHDGDIDMVDAGFGCAMPSSSSTGETTMYDCGSDDSTLIDGEGREPNHHHHNTPDEKNSGGAAAPPPPSSTTNITTPMSSDQFLEMARRRARESEEEDEIWRRKLGWY